MRHLNVLSARQKARTHVTVGRWAGRRAGRRAGRQTDGAAFRLVISKSLMGQFLHGTVPRHLWQSGAVACQLRYQEEAARMKLGHVTGCGVVLHQKDVL